jgi:WhiB family transcriptional regulator, redox-sensing transcriptional regulator
MTAIMSSQPWEEITVDDLPDDYEAIIEGYEPEDDEIAVKRTWEPPPAWMDFAACASSDPEAWYPDTGDPAVRARKICWTRCPVQLLCLDYAIEHNERHGIWGGLSREQRDQLIGKERNVLRGGGLKPGHREELERRGWDAVA